MSARIVAVTTAVLAGLVLAGPLPASAPVLEAIFGLTLTTAVFGGEPRRILSTVSGLVAAATKAVATVADDVSDD